MSESGNCVVINQNSQRCHTLCIFPIINITEGPRLKLSSVYYPHCHCRPGSSQKGVTGDQTESDQKRVTEDQPTTGYGSAKVLTEGLYLQWLHYLRRWRMPYSRSCRLVPGSLRLSLKSLIYVYSLHPWCKLKYDLLTIQVVPFERPLVHERIFRRDLIQQMGIGHRVFDVLAKIGDPLVRTRLKVWFY